MSDGDDTTTTWEVGRWVGCSDDVFSHVSNRLQTYFPRSPESASYHSPHTLLGSTAATQKTSPRVTSRLMLTTPTPPTHRDTGTFLFWECEDSDDQCTIVILFSEEVSKCLQPGSGVFLACFEKCCHCRAGLGSTNTQMEKYRTMRIELFSVFIYRPKLRLPPLRRKR